MKIAKQTASLLGAFTLSATLAHGQARTFFEDVKTFKQVGPEKSQYLGGSLNVTLIDGAYFILGCDDNGSPFYVGPYRDCPAGTTALVDSGDLDGDGLRDNRSYFSVGQIIPALQVQPFVPSLNELVAAPPSKLPRPLSGFAWRDNSVVLYYDLVNNPGGLQSYEITRYTTTRPYLATELKRHREEIVPGVYTFKFPALGDDRDRDFFIQVGHREMVEAFPGPGGLSVSDNGISVGNDFRLTNDEDVWRDGKMEIDPRIIFRLTWEGFNPSTFLAGDRQFFSLRDRFFGDIVYPPFPPGNFALPQLIGSGQLGIATSFELGPAFFSVGDQLTAELEFRRNNQAGNTTDRSVSFFTWDIDFIDTYDGFILETFPVDTPEVFAAPSVDFDNDGFTNLEEYALLTNVGDPASVPNPTPVIVPSTGQCILEIAKRPNVGNSLRYQVEYTTDLVNWITITRTDPNWYIEFDNEERYRVRSVLPFGETTCLTRIKITQNY